MTNWSNITVRESKPLVVTSPIINLIDPNTARFEWMQPLTYCCIQKYTLEFRLVTSSSSQDPKPPQTQQLPPPLFIIEILKPNSTSSHSILINSFHPFTVYSVILSACIGSQQTSDSCTRSLEKTFRTQGTIPSGLTRPLVRLISPKAVSIEWQEPAFRNGLHLQYQLVRNVLESNRTEAVYSGGTSLFYLDTSIKNGSTYAYRVIYTNEYGSSIGDYSNYIKINANSNGTDLDSLKNSSLQVIFGLETVCVAPSVANLTWQGFSFAEILTYLVTIFDPTQTLGIDELELKNLSVRVLFENKENGIVENRVLVSDRNETILKKDWAQMRNLVPRGRYSFSLDLLMEFRLNLSNLTWFRLLSETKECWTQDIYDAFNQNSLEFNGILILNRSNIRKDFIKNIFQTLEFKNVNFKCVRIAKKILSLQINTNKIRW